MQDLPDGQGDVVVTHPAEFVVPEDAAALQIEAEQMTLRAGEHEAALHQHRDIRPRGRLEEATLQTSPPQLASICDVDGRDVAVAADDEGSLHLS